jgi:hypothetical protein
MLRRKKILRDLDSKIDLTKGKLRAQRLQLINGKHDYDAEVKLQTKPLCTESA